ncbi:MAG: hypothetical protein V1738_02105 [Patescibacteria group bacterium]
MSVVESISKREWRLARALSAKIAGDLVREGWPEQNGLADHFDERKLERKVRTVIDIYSESVACAVKSSGNFHDAWDLPDVTDKTTSIWSREPWAIPSQLFVDVVARIKQLDYLPRVGKLAAGRLHPDKEKIYSSFPAIGPR